MNGVLSKGQGLEHVLPLLQGRPALLSVDGPRGMRWVATSDGRQVTAVEVAPGCLTERVAARLRSWGYPAPSTGARVQEASDEGRFQVQQGSTSDGSAYESALRIEALDVIVGALLWQRGRWQLELRADVSLPATLRLSVMAVLMAGVDLTEAWPVIRQEAFDLDLVVHHRLGEAQGALAPIHKVAQPGVSVRQLVAWRRESRWTTLHQLAQLAAQGFVKLSRPEDITTRRPCGHQRPRRIPSR